MIRTLTLLCALAATALAQSPAEPHPVLAGRTVDAKGQPVRKVSLTLRPIETNPAGDPLAPYFVTSDSAGNFEFYGLPTGRYRLMADRTGYLKTLYGARNTWAPGTILTLGAGPPLTGITVRMVEQAVLSGRVISDENASFWSVEVYQQQYQNGRKRWVCVDAVNTPGEFSFNKLKPGRYRLGVVGTIILVGTAEAAPGAPGYVTTYFPGVTDPAAAESIELRPGQTISDIRLPRLKAPMSALSGSVVRKAGGSSVSPLVYLAAAGSDSAGNVSLSARGRFKLDSIQAGSYILGVVEGTLDRRLLGWQTVRVSGDVEAPAFDLDSIALRGTVQFDHGAPSGAKLRVRLTPVEDPTPYYAQAEVMPDGTFAIPGSFAGPFRIDVEGLPAGAYLKSAAYGKQDALGVLNLAFQPGDEKLAIVLGANGAQISGAVRDEDGKPLDGVVTLIPDPPQPQKASLYRLAETAENGRFQFQGIPPGKYRLYAWEEFESGAQFDPEVTAPFQPRSVSIEVTEGERKEVTLPRIPADK